MKNLFLLLITIIVISFAGCTKCDAPIGGDISVRSTATYSDEPLVLFTEYDYSGLKIKFTRVDFLIEGFTLSGNNLASIKTQDSVFILKFTDSNESETGAINGIVKDFGSQTGAFNLLSFGVGVDSFINKKNPADFNFFPLNDFFYYWPAWNSYIFLKIEGSFDADNNGSFESGFAYHIGTNQLYKNNILLLKEPTGTMTGNEIHLNFDIKDVLAAGGNAIDIKTTPTSHNPADIAISQKLYSNLSTAISIK